MAKPDDSIIILDDDEDDEDRLVLEGSSPESCPCPPECRPQQELPSTGTPDAQTNGAGKHLGVTREGNSTLKMENQKLFAEFIEFCSKLTLEHPEVITYLKGRQQKTSPKFLSSTEFRNVIGRCLTRVQNKKSKVYVYINELCTVFKAHSEKKKLVPSSIPTTPKGAMEPAAEADSASDQPTEVGEKHQTGSRRQIRYLENLLKVYTTEIRRLQEKELDLQEMNDPDSTYIQENRLKRKMMRIFEKLCELKKCCSMTGRVIEQRIPYRGTRYPEVNRRVEKFINKPDNFPDYGDILKVIQKASIRHSLGLAKRQMQSMAQDAFREVGNRLQERRHLDMIYNFGNHLTDDYRPGHDPALSDPSLARHLRENRSQAVSSLEKVIKKYAEIQEENEEEERRKKREKTSKAAAGAEEPGSKGQSSTASEDVHSPASVHESELEEEEEEEEDSSDTDIEEELKNCQQASEAEEEEEETPEDEQISEITEGDQQMDNQPQHFSSGGDEEEDDDDDDDDDDEDDEEEEEEEEEKSLDNHSKDHEEDINCKGSHEEEARLETFVSQNNKEAVDHGESREDLQIKIQESSASLESNEAVTAHETEPESLPLPDSNSWKTKSTTQEFVLEVEALPLDSNESQSPGFEKTRTSSLELEESPAALSKAMSPRSLDPFVDSGCPETAFSAMKTSPTLSPKSPVAFPDLHSKSPASLDPDDSANTSLAPADNQAVPLTHSRSPNYQRASPCHFNNSSASPPPQRVSSGSQVSEEDSSIKNTPVSACTRTEFPKDTHEVVMRVQEKMPQGSAGESGSGPAEVIESSAFASLDTLGLESLSPKRPLSAGGSRGASPQILEKPLTVESTREARPWVPERPLSAGSTREVSPRVPERPLSADASRMYSGPGKNSTSLCHKKRTLSGSCSPPASCKEATNSLLENGGPVNTNLNGQPRSSMLQSCQPQKRLRREEDDSYGYEQIQSIDSGEKVADLSLDMQVTCESPTSLLPTLDSPVCSPVSNSQHGSLRAKKLIKINAATQCDPEEIIVLSDSD